MTKNVYLMDDCALGVQRLLRAEGRLDLSSPSRIRSLANCAQTASEIAKALAEMNDVVGCAGSSLFQLRESNDGAARPAHPVPLRLAVPHAAARPQSHGVTSCVLPAKFAPGMFYRLGEHVFVLSPEETFRRIAARLSFPKLVMAAMEMCGTYAFDPRDGTYRFDARPIASVDDLKAYFDRFQHSRGTATARAVKALQYAVDGSASPMETIVEELLVLPHRDGGYALDLPAMNLPISPDGEVVPATSHGCRVIDLAWPDAKVAVEYNGRAYHHGIDDYARDSDRRDELEAHGFRVFAVSAEKLYSVERFHSLAVEIARLTKRRLRMPSSFAQKRAALREEILPSCRRERAARGRSSSNTGDSRR